jgi:hypothetical protein
VVGQFFRITYSGVNNDAAQLVTAGNWSAERLGDTATTTPAANGDGLTFTGRPYAVAINEDLMVNGEPTLYITDAVNHVLFKVTRNLLSTSTAADWDWLIVVGQTGVAGNTDGIGTAATLNGPRGIDYENGFLYLANRLSHTVRRVDVATLDVITYFGVAATSGTNMQFDF